MGIKYGSGPDDVRQGLDALSRVVRALDRRRARLDMIQVDLDEFERLRLAGYRVDDPDWLARLERTRTEHRDLRVSIEADVRLFEDIASSLMRASERM